MTLQAGKNDKNEIQLTYFLLANETVFEKNTRRLTYRSYFDRLAFITSGKISRSNLFIPVIVCLGSICLFTA